MLAGSLEIELMANLARIKKDLDDAKKLVGDFSDFTKKAAGVAAAALAAVGVGLSVSSFVGWIKGAIDAADAAGDLALKMGVATKQVAGLQLAFKFSDLENQAMVASMGRLSTNILKGSQAFDVLNVKTKDSAGQFRGTQEVLYEVADRFKGLDDGALKTALAIDLFGKSGADMLPMLDGGSEGMREMAEMAERLGLVVSKDTADAAGAFNDTLDLISLSSQGVAQGIAAQVLPTLQTLTGQFFETLTEGDNLRKVSDFLAASMKILYSVGVGVVQVFSTVGKTLGAAAAQVAALLSGDFKGAKAVGSAWVEDMKADWTGAANTIWTAWNKSGDAQVAKMSEVVRKTKLNEEALKKYGQTGKESVDEVTKAFDALVKKLSGDIVKGAVAAEAAQHGYNKAQTEYLEIVRSPEWAKFSEARRVQITQLAEQKIAQEQAADAIKKEAEATAEAVKALDDLLAKRTQAADAAAAAVLAQQQENAAIGLTGVALAQLQQARANESAANVQAQAAIIAVIPGREAEAAAMVRQANAMRELAGLKVQGAGLQEAQDAAKALEASLDPSKPKDFGAALKDAFGEAGNALAQMANALQDYGQAMAEIQKDRENLDKVTDPQKRAKLEIDLSRKTAQAQISSYASIAGAAKGFFKEHSTGYRAMEAAEKAFRVAEMALALDSMAQKLFGIQSVLTATIAAEATKSAAVQAGVATQVAADATKGASAAAVGVATQAQGDPYSAFVRMAAMAAMMAALGFAVGGGGGGASQGYTGIAAGGTGTVLGAEGEASKSIANAIEMLADNSKIELVIGQRMLSELTKVVEGIAGLAADISSDFFIRGMAGGSFGDSFLDSGVGFLPGQSVGDIIRDGVQGVGFNLLFQNGAMAMWKELDPAFKRSVGDVLGNIAETIVNAADLLGLNDGSLVDRMLSIIPTLGDTSTYLMNGILQQGGGLLSFKDKSGKEIQEELQAVFSSVGDQMVGAALPALKRFQMVGEGMFETLVRVTSGIERAEYALERYGITAINYADIVRDSGDVATEIVRQSVTALEPLGSGVAKILDVFTGEFEDLLDLYDQLMTVRGLLRDIGADDMLLGTDQVRGAGGIDSLLSGIEAFRDGFYSEQEQVAAAWARMSEQFDILGVSMPRTVEDFRALALAQDQSTVEGAQLFGGLMALASAFKDVTDRSADLAAAAEQAAQAQAEAAEEAARRIADSWANLYSALDGVVADFMSGDDLRQYRAGRISEQLAGIGFSFSPEQILGAGKQDFEDLYRSIDKTTVAGREQATGLIGLWSAFKQLLPATVDAAAALEALRKAAQQQSDAAWSALQASIAAQKQALQKAYDEQTKIVQERTQAAVAAQQDRLTAITGIFNALDAAIGSTRVETLELTRARRDASQAYLAQALVAGRAGQSLTGFPGLESALQAVAEPSEDLYSTFEDYAVDQAKTASDIWNLRQISQGQMTTAELTLKAIQSAGDAQLRALKEQYDADIAALDETLAFWRMQIDLARGTYSATLSVADAVRAMDAALRAEREAAAAAAAGVDGSHATGLAYVPRDGYVAELHRGERVLTSQDNAIFSSGAWARGSGDGAVVAELRELRAEVSALRAQQADESSAADEKLSTMADALDDAVTGRRPLQTEIATEVAA